MINQLLEPHFIKKIFKFGIVGGSATGIHIGLVSMLVEWANMSPVIATFPAYLLALSWSYTLNQRWTFKAQGHYADFLPKFLLVSLMGLVVCSIIMYGCELWQIHYQIGLLITVIVVPMYSFFLNHFWVFRHTSA
ncbi:GtrA family protein [Candidatus Albibeggiatoa sp. nov. BB20]|uniref:GtrA family protein n=1 Tax=Candidatus Albibeggiatoa sp. nov. BB20 TaxID=3162723 RepID=UPI003365A5C3